MSNVMSMQEFHNLTKGHFFTVVFTKKDGTIRTLNGLDRVKAYIKGTGKPITDGRVVVWDRQVFRGEIGKGLHRKEAGSKSYRSIWPESIIELRVNGKIYDKFGNESA